MFLRNESEHSHHLLGKNLKKSRFFLKSLLKILRKTGFTAANFAQILTFPGQNINVMQFFCNDMHSADSLNNSLMSGVSLGKFSGYFVVLRFISLEKGRNVRTEWIIRIWLRARKMNTKWTYVRTKRNKKVVSLNRACLCMCIRQASTLRTAQSKEQIERRTEHMVSAGVH
jgi:hypothetical protein